jgi:uncharacterized glyoxalase superfamily protein PhnB
LLSTFGPAQQRSALRIMSTDQPKSPDTAALLQALGQARDLCQRLDLPEEAAKFEGYRIRFQKEPPTYEVLQDQVGEAINGIAALRILAMLGKDHSEFHRLQTAFGAVLFPHIDEQAKEESLEARVDKHGDKIMASSAKAEARHWMKQASHVFFSADPKKVSKFVEQFYGAGAIQVLIADIEEHDGIQYGEAVLVVLPKEAKARARLFQIGSRAEGVFENDPVSDKGQKYLYYSLG